MATLKSGSQKHIDEFVRNHPDVAEKIRQYYKENPTEKTQLREQLEDCDVEVKALYKDKADLEVQLAEAQGDLLVFKAARNGAVGELNQLRKELKEARDKILDIVEESEDLEIKLEKAQGRIEELEDSDSLAKYVMVLDSRDAWKKTAKRHGDKIRIMEKVIGKQQMALEENALQRKKDE